LAAAPVPTARAAVVVSLSVSRSQSFELIVDRETVQALSRLGMSMFERSPTEVEASFLGFCFWVGCDFQDRLAMS
jgi:hypothetical protein